MSAFDELLQELEPLTKAMAAEEDANGSEGLPLGEEAPGEEEPGEEEPGEEGLKNKDETELVGDGKGEPMGKSFQAVTAAGQQVEVLDAELMLKSLSAQVTETQEGTARALGGVVSLLKSMNARIGALQEDLAAIGGQGRGRKAVVSVMEKQPVDTITKAEGMTRGEFFAKAQSALKAGRITGHEIAVAESYLGRGAPIPENILRQVTGA